MLSVVAIIIAASTAQSNLLEVLIFEQISWVLLWLVIYMVGVKVIIHTGDVKRSISTIKLIIFMIGDESMWCWLICRRIVIKLCWLKRLIFKVLDEDLLLLLIFLDLDLMRQDSCRLENNLFIASLFIWCARWRLNVFLLSSILVFNRDAIE